jgi:peptidoglycan/xylan/chitin deacetylase (PgdA/CDA1 family)
LHRLLLTFDVEDFINSNAVYALHTILKMLNRYKLRAMFFITGHMAEKLSSSPEILDLLKGHEIGFHSSSHSVHPIIPEYTDVESYRRAYSVSLERETAHINPLTGRVEAEGGVYFLQDLFSPKKIEAYRAPGMSWTPPHLEALVDLGIKYDFSSNITTSEPVDYKTITFYPYTLTQQWAGNLSDYKVLLHAILRRKVAIFDLHPALYVNQGVWDSIYFKGNPQTLLRIPNRSLDEVTSMFSKFELLLKRIKLIYNTKLIEVDPHLSASTKRLILGESDVQECYESSIRWPRKFFGYHPRYIRGHFQEFFQS